MNPELPENRTILAVDDRLENLKILIKYLEDSGYELMVANSGEEALKHVDRIIPDIILLDVLMPGIDGFETCLRLKKKKATRDIPVLFMTALTETVDKVKGFEVGAADYLTKPLQHEEVLARVNAHLCIRKFQQQLQQQNDLLQQKNTLLKKQKQELRESEARFRGLSEATFEGILIHDEGLLLDGNEALERMFGYKRTEVVGKNFIDFLTPASRKPALSCMQTKCENPYEAVGIRKDGSLIPLEIQGKTMPRKGKDVRVVAIRDLTWRKAMEEEKARIQQENLNFSMKTLRFVTHELKSPLSTMQTMLTVMLEGYMGEVSEDIGEYLLRIRHNCEDLQDMVKNYLDISRLGMGELVARKASVNYFKEIVAPCVEQTQILFESHELTLSVICPENLTVQGDHDLLRIAMTNYLTNAAKYAVPKSQARLTVTEKKGNLITSVWNEGTGFLPKEQEMLFTKFSRLKNENTRKQRGSGLGLYLVKNIIELHDGEVWAESAPGKWAKFCFSFPTKDENIVQKEKE
jgi:PAS domain S-box-containing protein